MAKYVTKQRRQLLDYLSRHTDEQMTARQIADALTQENISLSAVYRNLPIWKRTGCSSAASARAHGMCSISTLPPRNVKTACTSPAGYAERASIWETRKRSGFLTVR